MTEQKRYLTPKQMNFVRFYVNGFDVVTAAIRANYSPERAGQLLDDELVQQKIQELIDARMLGRDEDTADWVDQQLKEIADIAMVRGELGHANRALTLLMQHKDNDLMAANRVQVEEISRDEFMSRLRAGRARASGGKDEPSFF